MKHVVRSLTIAAPVRNVYNQWTQFEHHARFLSAGSMVRQLDDTRVAWRVRVWGRWVKWRMEIYEQKPDRYIAWRSAPGGSHGGNVTFDAIDGDTTRVTVTVSYQPHGTLARIWTALGAIEWHVGGFLLRFRRFIEPRSYATGGWRGRIHDGVILLAQAAPTAPRMPEPQAAAIIPRAPSSIQARTASPRAQAIHRRTTVFARTAFPSLAEG